MSGNWHFLYAHGREWSWATPTNRTSESKRIELSCIDGGLTTERSPTSAEYFWPEANALTACISCALDEDCMSVRSVDGAYSGTFGGGGGFLIAVCKDLQRLEPGLRSQIQSESDPKFVRTQAQFG